MTHTGENTLFLVWSEKCNKYMSSWVRWRKRTEQNYANGHRVQCFLSCGSSQLQQLLLSMDMDPWAVLIEHSGHCCRGIIPFTKFTVIAAVWTSAEETWFKAEPESRTEELVEHILSDLLGVDDNSGGMRGFSSHRTCAWISRAAQVNILSCTSYHNGHTWKVHVREASKTNFR